MANEVLSREDMLYLQKLGLDCSKASMKFVSRYPSCDYIMECDYFVPVSISFDAKRYDEAGYTFTLQDILSLLPKVIEIDGIEYSIRIINGNPYNEKSWEISYQKVFDSDALEYYSFTSGDLLDSAYRMLCWCIEHKFIKEC